MVTMQIRLPEDQADRVGRIAGERGLSPPQVIVDIVADYLLGAQHKDRAQIKARALAAIGAGRSGVPDLGLRHDHYLAGDATDGLR